tara:strand:+ start:360 stop:1157 length:798 start_codon:yes stop_codon:yes gene_type:complete
MAFFNQFPKRTYDLQRDGNDITITDTFRNVDVNDKLIDTISAYQYYQIKDGERPDHVATKLYNNAGYYWSFFVVNDNLKKGYGSWPMSYTQFDDYMNDNYRAYSIMELEQDDFSSVSAISNFTSLSVAFQFDSPSANQSPNDILGTIFKIDTETNQVWVKDPSERLINSLDGRARHEFVIFDNTDGANFSPSFVPKNAWGYGDNATAYYKDSNDKRIGIYDSPKPGLVTYREFEEDENEKLKSIRIVKPDQIGAFAELYKTLINE